MTGKQKIPQSSNQLCVSEKYIANWNGLEYFMAFYLSSFSLMRARGGVILKE